MNFVTRSLFLSSRRCRTPLYCPLTTSTKAGSNSKNSEKINNLSPNGPKKIRTIQAIMQERKQRKDPLPKHIGLKEADIMIIQTEAQLNYALKMLSSTSIIGLETETRSVYDKEIPVVGPHLVQLATSTKSFLFGIKDRNVKDEISMDQMRLGLQSILEDKKIRKVGMGLGNDLASLKNKLNIIPNNVIDLSLELRKPGEKELLSTRKIVAHVLGLQFVKDVNVAKSNWARNPIHYTAAQIIFAGNQPHIAVKVFEEWQIEQKKAAATAEYVASKAL